MAMQGRHLNRKEVLAWNEPWTTRDRLRVTAALDAVPNGVYIVPPFGGYIGVWINGRRALVICPGYMWWPGGRGTQDLPPDLFPDMHADEHGQWHELSTFRMNTGGPTIPELRAEVCPRCFMELPMTGVCDNCG
jgi:hypothetical protein